MLLLHGITSSAQSWVRVGPALADRYRVYALDQRGHGDSIKPSQGAYSLRQTADDALAFMEDLKAKQYLPAHSSAIEVKGASHNIHRSTFNAFMQQLNDFLR